MSKVFKKAFSVAAASLLFAGAGLTAVNAAEITSGDGTITIANAQNSVSYTAYKIFDVSAIKQPGTPVNPGVEWVDTRTAAYIATEDQKTFFDNANLKLFNFTKTASGDYNVTAAKGVDGAKIAEFLNKKSEAELKATFDYKTVNATSDGKLYISDVPYGYYYVKTNTGAVASINTATPSVTITDKSKPTVVDKKVNHPEKTVVDEDHSTAYVGEVKMFEITTNLEPGLSNFVITDTMGTGLEYVNDSLSVEIDNAAATNEQVEKTVDKNTIEISFKENYLKTLTTTKNVTVTYRATVTDAAVADGVTQNTVRVNPGNNSPVTDATKIFLGKADFTKVDAATINTGDPKVLAGAVFEIYSAETGGTALKFIKDEETNTYRYAKSDTGVSTTSTLISGDDGMFHVTGLPEGDYWLQETKAPAGYNLMTSRQKFTVTLSINSETKEHEVNTIVAQIQNTKGGATLPSTGGMGTTAMYTIGGLMVAGAAVIFVVRKRMTA